VKDPESLQFVVCWLFVVGCLFVCLFVFFLFVFCLFFVVVAAAVVVTTPAAFFSVS